MKNIRGVEKLKVLAGILVALLFAAFAGLFTGDVLEIAAADDLNEAVQCSFIIPPEFTPFSEPGLFYNKSYPMESSSIKYSIYDNGKNRVLTNREKKAIEDLGNPVIVDETTKLTKDIYQMAMKEAFDSEYGQDVNFAVTGFENKTFDGFPGYRINQEFQENEQEKIYQTVYIVLSKYKTFTITYQRAEDDDCEDMFEMSAATIHVR